jgi:alkylhydroperoxidase family enzyme
MPKSRSADRLRDDRRMRLDQPRIAPLAPEQIDPELWSKLGPGQTRNIFRTLAHHPKLATRSMVYGSHLLYKSSLPGRLREIAILRVGWLCQSEYEFGQHTLIGRTEGLSDVEIERLTHDPGSEQWALWAGPERVVLAAVQELHDDWFVTDATWAALTAELTTEQVLDLIHTVGHYHTVSMLLNSCGVQREPDTPGFPEGTAT